MREAEALASELLHLPDKPAGVNGITGDATVSKKI